MRVFAVVALILLLLEAVLILAFLGGFYWLGGWVPGALLCAVVLLLLILPWIGDLAVHFDSAAGCVAVRLSWWGNVSYQWKLKPELCVRLLGIPWRKRMDKRERKAEPEARRRRRRTRTRWGRENVGPLVRVIVSGLQATHELLVEARELSVGIAAPTQIRYADQAIAGVVGRRRLGPLTLSCAADGERQVAVHYRIGLLRAALTGLYVAVQTTPWRLARSMRAEKDAEPKEAD